MRPKTTKFNKQSYYLIISKVPDHEILIQQPQGLRRYLPILNTNIVLWKNTNHILFSLLAISKFDIPDYSIKYKYNKPGYYAECATFSTGGGSIYECFCCLSDDKETYDKFMRKFDARNR